jgi:hypothetical protein
MYRDGGGRRFDAGHGALGVPAPALRWYLAEGATGSFFDTFVLIATPGGSDADVQVSFLLPGGDVVVQRHAVPARSRATLWVDGLDPRLADTAVSVVLESLNGVPVVVERAMWWPGPTAASWEEAHVSAGVTAPAARWLAAGGESGGSRGTATYLLLANTLPIDSDVDVTLLFEDRPPVTHALTIGATSRVGLDVAAVFPDAGGRQYGLLVEAHDPNARLVVERAAYWNEGGRFWAAGVNAVARPLPE